MYSKDKTQTTTKDEGGFELQKGLLDDTENQVKSDEHTHKKKTDFQEYPKKPSDGKPEEEVYEINNPSFIYHFVRNWKAGLTVALVNLPLSISLAVAASSTPQAGVISAICCGICCGLWGGSHFNITGPTGALSGFLSIAVMHWNNHEEYPHAAACMLVFAIACGIFCYLAQMMNFQRYIQLFPESVNEGFTLGIAVIILCKQLNFALGLDGLLKHEDLLSNLGETFRHLHGTYKFSVVIFFSFLALFYIVKAVSTKIPPQPVLTFCGIALGLFCSNYICDSNLTRQQLIDKDYDPDYNYWKIPGFRFLTLRDKYHDLSLIPALMIRDMRLDILYQPLFYIDLFPIVIVGILETLISAKIADKQTKTKFDAQQELKALAYSNISAGIFGGLPVTAALARTALNVKSGAKHRTSALINGVLVALIALLIFQQFQYLPYPVIAAQVTIVGINMVDTKTPKMLYRFDKEHFRIYTLTVLFCIVVDTTAGLIIGIFVFAIRFAERMMQSQHDFAKSKQEISFYQSQKQLDAVDDFIQITKDSQGKIPEQQFAETTRFYMYRLVGPFTFMNFKNHEHDIHTYSHHAKKFILDFHYVHFVDLEAWKEFKVFLEDLEKANGTQFYLLNVSKSLVQQMQDVIEIEEDAKKDPNWFIKRTIANIQSAL